MSDWNKIVAEFWCLRCGVSIGLYPERGAVPPFCPTCQQQKLAPHPGWAKEAK